MKRGALLCVKLRGFTLSQTGFSFTQQSGTGSGKLEIQYLRFWPVLSHGA
tara:strand:- start:2640 stop:2789 length:150 start_codon:yes stop_codon:yes gene_type:complete